MGIIKHPKLEALERECSENLKAALDEAEAFQFAEFDAKEVERTGYSNYSYWGSTFRAFCKNKLALALVFIVLIILAFTFLQPYLPGQFDAFAVNNDPETGIPLRNEPPNSVHWLGTNSIGQDLWSRLWQGTRTSLLIGLAVACIEAVVGITVGVLWGYVRKLDFVFTELYNIINNVPTIIYMTLIALLVGQSFTIMAISLIAFGWLTMARNVRNLVLMYRDREYNLASRCLGTPIWRILVKNILPYLISVIILRLALSIPSTIALESTLSYLGLGLDVTTPSLGILLRNARNYFLNYPYLLVFPAVIVSLITVTFYLIGNAFSDAADPRNHV